MTGEGVYLDARMALFTEQPLTAQAEVIAHDVAAELRTQLGGSDSIVPDIGKSMPWYALPAELVLVARPNGEMTWRGFSESGDSAAFTVLARALDATRHRGLALMRWPERYVADSLVVRLTLIVGQDIDDSSFASLRPRRVQIRAFNMLVPRETSAHPNDYIDIRYPRNYEREQITGSVLTEFVVDTNGKAIMSTFKGLRSAGSPTAESPDGYYAKFLEAVRDGVSKEYFVPARVGACPVKQIVRLPVEFAPPRGSRVPH